MHETSPNSPPDKTDIRDQIRIAASSEFAASGLQGASVRAIAARAGTTAAMINYYYGTKRALYDVVVEAAQARLFTMLTDALDPSDIAHLPSRLAGAYFDFLSEERELPRLLLREVLDQGDSVQVMARRYVEPLGALFEQLFGSDDQTFHLAVSLFGAIAGYFMYAPVLEAVLGDDPLSGELLAQRRHHVMHLAALVTRTTTT